MAADKQIIIEALNNAMRDGTGAVFAIGEFYVQAAIVSPGEILSEAVSHHYHSGIDISLESSFTAMGYLLEEGGNYSRKYNANDAAAVEKIAADYIKIFEELYRADPDLPFEVTEL